MPNQSSFEQIDNEWDESEEDEWDQEDECWDEEDEDKVYSILSVWEYRIKFWFVSLLRTLRSWLGIDNPVVELDSDIPF